MDFELTPGFHELIEELLSVCDPHAVYTFYSENAVYDFYVKRTFKGDLHFYGKTLESPSSQTDHAVRERFYKWITKHLSTVINVRSYRNKIDPVAHDYIQEIRGYSIKYENGRINYKKIDGKNMQVTLSIDPTTGKPTKPRTNEKFP